MNLAPDITLFFQLAIFLTVLAALNFLLFKPLLRVFDKRKGATEGVKDEVLRLKQEAEQKLKEYEDRMSQARLQGAAHKEKIKKTGEEEASRIIAQARGDSDARLKEVQTALSKEASEARLLLRKTVEQLGEEMAEKVLEKKLA